MDILPNPVSKSDKYLKAIIDGQTENLPNPESRIDYYLKYIAENKIGGSGVSDTITDKEYADLVESIFGSDK